MVKLSISEAADRLGISPQRVRVLAASNRIEAERIGHRWLVDDASLSFARQPHAGRPISSRNAWALLALLAGQSPDWVDPSVRYRLRKRMVRDSGWLEQALMFSEARAAVR